MIDPKRLELDLWPGEPWQAHPDRLAWKTWLDGATVDLERLQSGWRPTTEEIERAAAVDEWRLTGPEGLCLGGIAWGHPTIANGHWIITSQLCAIDSTNWKWARTVSRLYKLGRRKGSALKDTEAT